METVTSELSRLRQVAQLVKDQVMKMTLKAKGSREMALRALDEAKQLAQEVRGHQPGISDVIMEKISSAMKSAKRIGRGKRK